MSAVLKENSVSIEDYLAGELISEIKHEYEDGSVYAMASTSRNHEKIIGNLYTKFRTRLEKLPCDVFTSNIKVHVSKTKFYYPDVMVVCGDEQGDEYYTEKPILIVEVLSKSTRRKDHTSKRFAYRQIETLQEYIVIEQDFVEIEVARRSANWQSQHYFLGDEVTFESIDLTLSVAEIYQRVENEDMQDYLQQMALEQVRRSG